MPKTLTIPSSASTADQGDRIFLHGLAVECIIGLPIAGLAERRMRARGRADAIWREKVRRERLPEGTWRCGCGQRKAGQNRAKRGGTPAPVPGWTRPHDSNTSTKSDTYIDVHGLSRGWRGS